MAALSQRPLTAEAGYTQNCQSASANRQEEKEAGNMKRNTLLITIKLKYLTF